MAFRNFLDDEQELGPGPGESVPGTPPPLPPSGPYTGGLEPYWIEDSGGGGRGGGAATFTGSARPSFNFEGVPEFVPPDFQPPSFEDASREPGFRFRLQGGTDALERSAAARGTLRTGGTLSDIMQFGQNFAAQEYNNVFQRQLAAFDRRYAGAKDRFAPKFAGWQTRSQAEIAAALAGFGREWDIFQHNNNSGGGGGGSNLYSDWLSEEPSWDDGEGF